MQVKLLSEWEAAGVPDMLSVEIPAHNEQGHIAEVVRNLDSELTEAVIQHEILIVNDNSQDRTEDILQPRLPGWMCGCGCWPKPSLHAGA